MKVALRGRTYETISGGTTGTIFKYGLVEFLGLGGSYVDTFLNGGLYKYGVVHSNRITIRAVNVAAEPIIVACAAMPATFLSGSPTLSEVVDHPTCRRAICGASTGQDKAQVVNAASAREVLGQDYQIARYQMDYTQATSSTPIVSSEPVWVMWISSFNSLNAYSCRIEIEIDWNVEFYNLDSF
jgi:hypothetical protein